LKEELQLKEKIKLLEQELITLTEKVESISKALREIEDIKQEIKGIKIFLGRVHPEFKSKYPEIMQKLFKKG
jgi:cell division septum initiation protein DivIVA